ncbi:MAG: radical SAM protein [Syntrophomonadaceae bacterium]|nr:radical SAM protein [Syntrophomonadaceae bacterium]
MSTWKLSQYTVVFRGSSGEGILHNSFMGALAVVPQAEFNHIENLLHKELTEDDIQNKTLNELCHNGFFVPTHIDEKIYVNDILKKENRNRFFDIVILPHENCNFRCTYCYETHTRGRMEKKVVEGLKQFVESKSAEYPGIEVRWFGGEPLLAADIISELSESFLRSCRKNQVPYRSNITTNGYLLTPKMFDSMLKGGIHDFHVTLDGPEEVHNQTRKLINGGKTFETIFRNLICIKEREDNNFKVSIRVNFNDESLARMGDFFITMSQTFGNDNRFGLYFRPIGKYGGPNDDNFEVCDYNCAKSTEMDLSFQYAEYGALDKLVQQSLQSHGYVCYASRETSVVVGADGTVYKCSVDFDNERNRVGRLLPDGRLDVNLNWDLWVNHNGYVNEICDTCPIYPLCQGKYCPKKSILLNKPICPLTITTYSKLIQIASGSHVKFQ